MHQALFKINYIVIILFPKSKDKFKLDFLLYVYLFVIRKSLVKRLLSIFGFPSHYHSYIDKKNNKQ